MKKLVLPLLCVSFLFCKSKTGISSGNQKPDGTFTIGNHFENGKWLDVPGSSYRFSVRRDSSLKTFFLPKSKLYKIFYDTLIWKNEYIGGENDACKFTKIGERNAVVMVNAVRRYLSDSTIKAHWQSFYESKFDEIKSLPQKTDLVNGVEYRSYFYVTKLKGSHIVHYNLLYSNVNTSIVVTTMCYGVDHMKLYHQFMELVSGVEIDYAN